MFPHVCWLAGTFKVSSVLCTVRVLAHRGPKRSKQRGCKMSTDTFPCRKYCPSARGEVCVESPCNAYSNAQRALHSFFKWDSFRPGQLAAVLPSLHGRDVFVRMATAAGKSLCMYLVPLATGPDALGVVISPLIGLMDQQI